MPNKTEETTDPGNEVAELGFNSDIVGNDELNAIESYSDALALLGIEGLTPDETAAFLEWDTNPFEPVDKSALIGQPMLIVQWRFVQGDFGSFVVCHAIVQLGNGTSWLVLFTDGSTGICRQLDELTNKRLADLDADGADPTKLPKPQMGALIRGGLSPSDYTVTASDGKELAARTYYLSNSPKKQ